ncbi:Ack-related non-receptor tyrosine kinase [Caenorhabditis elegans]|uniref:Isoform b of Ack-related non-receptor tyrosine kinase n=1 Tax=Caenorhabditis elegans TaxID=6239 RepID=G5EBZ8-2|nr:Ack-related non-receptor tyrosine kinase [Caenorhabditis elegans]CAZ39159.1 Ack-related non-receptor tyrosine kinase [Caenorhabditis elegans]|eukprot:NP_001255653.1 Ack-related non-receptor tyrosine kinase [Caenorhabditis elegans]
MREEPTAGTADATLNKLLQAADLSGYESDLRRKLKLRNAADLQYVEEVDLLSVGMSRPEQKRLRKEYTKMFPSGIFGKVKKAFKRAESLDRKTSNSVANQDDNDHHVIPIEKITLCKELGQGEFGSVWQAGWKNSAGSDVIQVAVKCVGSDKLLATSSSFLQEAAIMTRMRHEHVVRLYGVVLDTKKIMLVSELATCGSLLECLHKPALRDSFPVHVLCDYAEQIAMGMSYLELQRLIHRDLAARNVLVFSPKLVKISDFGLSRSLGIGEDYYRSEFTPNLKLPIAWCAPECINFLKFTSKSDVWAYGVTIWEMFSYGEMPWKGRSGAQILELVDRKKELLTRPKACPEDIYDMLKETWTHQVQDRPTFSDIVAKFPERRAQSVRAVVDCKDSAADHLHFKKDDLIVVISRSPAQYPDGYYWFGSLRNGKLGLFRPTDTVAHLGSEPPCSNGTIENGFSEKEKGGKKNKKAEKESERERKKLLISEPVGDVRHTCHVGIDGTAFGLLQLDKKAMCPTSSSPSTSRGSQASPAPSHTSSSTTSSVHLRETVARNGVPIKETMSLRDVGPLSRDALNLRDTVSPPVARAPSQPPSYSQPRPPPRSVSSVSSGNQHSVQVHDQFSSLDRSRGSLTPTAPPLTASAANSLKDPLTGISLSIPSNNLISYMDDQEDDHRWTRSPGAISQSTTLTALSSSRKDPIPAPRGPVAAVYARGKDIPTPASKSDIALCEKIEDLNRDLTNYSIGTICDYSEDRPLLDSMNRTISSSTTHQPPPQSSEARIRFMTEQEVRKINEKSAREHRKTEDLLREERQKEQKPGEIEEPQQPAESLYSTRTPQQEGWSSAAQEAYKLLVECGTNLKQASVSPPPMSPTSSRLSTLDRSSISPAPPRPVTPPLSVRNETISMRKSQQEEMEHVTVEENSPKRVHIIETKLIDGPARGMSPIQDRHIPAFTTPMSNGSFRKAPAPTPVSPAPAGSTDQKPPPCRPPKTRQFPLVIDERNLAYDNLNGFGAGARVAPPVPPKPKVSFADDQKKQKEVAN